MGPNSRVEAGFGAIWCLGFTNPWYRCRCGRGLPGQRVNMEWSKPLANRTLRRIRGAWFANEDRDYRVGFASGWRERISCRSYGRFVADSSQLGARDFQSGLSMKRIGSGALMFDRAGRLLIVKPSYNPGWEIPGLIVKAEESPLKPADATSRRYSASLLSPPDCCALTTTPRQRTISRA